jgi:CheY-like chemotaxis protein
VLALNATTASVMVDRGQFEQIMVNLVVNARHAMPKGGRLTIETASIEMDEHYAVTHLAAKPGSYVALIVTDTGTGMSADVQARIFEPFFTTKEVGQGTGLGLAVVHGVMRSHIGAVDVQSTPGVGSTFTLYFPANAPVAMPPPAEPAAPAGVKGNGKHVMYVDDDQALVFLVERLLKRRGFRVSGFSDPNLAAAELRANAQNYDLLVTDYNMPGYCGVDLVREARRIRPDLPVALASGYVTAEIEQSAIAEGARALIHKPNDVEELCATVQRLITDSEA